MWIFIFLSKLEILKLTNEIFRTKPSLGEKLLIIWEYEKKIQFQECKELLRSFHINPRNSLVDVFIYL